MLKTVATYAAFLAVISCLYYVSYWWPFNIDVTPFLEPQSLVLGLLFPIRYSGFHMLFICAAAVLNSILGYNYRVKRQKLSQRIDSIEDRSKKLSERIETATADDKASIVAEHTAISEEFNAINEELGRNKGKTNDEEKESKIEIFFKWSEPILIIIMFLFFIKYPDSRSSLYGFVYVSAGAIARLLRHYEVVPPNIFELNKERFSSIYTIDTTFLTLAVFLVISSIATGYSESASILQGLRFNYVLNKDLPNMGKKGYKMYLGAVKDKFIFADSINSEHFIIDKDSMKIVRFRPYYHDDAQSVKIFKALLYPKKINVLPKPISLVKQDSIAVQKSASLGKVDKAKADKAK